MDFVKILGCGSALPTGSRKPTAQLIKHREHFFLVDCGEGTQMRIREAQVSFNRITHIFISHLHGDHFFGLPGFLSSLQLLGRSKALHLYGPKGLMDVLNLQFELSGTSLAYPLHFHETNPSKKSLIMEDETITVFSIPLNHRIPCTGFLFEEKKGPDHLLPEMMEKYDVPKNLRHGIKMGGDYQVPGGELIAHDDLCKPGKSPVSYAFCSDNRIKEGLHEDLTGVDYIYHETTFMEREVLRAKKTYHSTAKEAAKLGKALDVKLLIMGHYSARYADLSAMEAEAKTVFNRVVLGTEGMEIQLR